MSMELLNILPKEVKTVPSTLATRRLWLRKRFKAVVSAIISPSWTHSIFTVQYSTVLLQPHDSATLFF